MLTRDQVPAPDVTGAPWNCRLSLSVQLLRPTKFIMSFIRAATMPNAATLSAQMRIHQAIRFHYGRAYLSGHPLAVLKLV